MGRRPLAQKRQRKAPPSKSEVTDPSGEVEKQPESSTPTSEQAKLLPEETNPQVELIEPEQNAKTNLSVSVSKRKKSKAVGRPRRSDRLQAAVSRSQDQDIERIIEEITVSGSEKDEESFDPEEEEKLPEPTVMHDSLAEKVDYLLQQFEEQKKTIEDLKLKVASVSSPTVSPGAADVRYKSLYFNSQKKIETLEDENHRLALELKHAFGKAEAYEKGASVFAEGLEKLKDMILVTNLTKATETAMKFSSQAVTSMDAGAEVKRKRVGTRK